MGVPKIKGNFWGGSCNKDDNGILGSILGYSSLGNYKM